MGRLLRDALHAITNIHSCTFSSLHFPAVQPSHLFSSLPSHLQILTHSSSLHFLVTYTLTSLLFTSLPPRNSLLFSFLHCHLHSPSSFLHFSAAQKLSSLHFPATQTQTLALFSSLPDTYMQTLTPLLFAPCHLDTLLLSSSLPIYLPTFFPPIIFTYQLHIYSLSFSSFFVRLRMDCSAPFSYDPVTTLQTTNPTRYLSSFCSSLGKQCVIYPITPTDANSSGGGGGKVTSLEFSRSADARPRVDHHILPICKSRVSKGGQQQLVGEHRPKL